MFHTNDARAIARVDKRHGTIGLNAMRHNAARVFECMNAVGGPFHIERFIEIYGLDRRAVDATITYINESALPYYVECARYAKVFRWRLVACDSITKSKYQLRARLHAAKSRRVIPWSSIECTIDKL